MTTSLEDAAAARLRGHLEHFKDLNARKDAAGSGLAYSAVCDDQMALIDRVDATEMQVSMGTGEDGLKDHFDLIVDGDGHGGTDIIGIEYGYCALDGEERWLNSSITGDDFDTVARFAGLPVAIVVDGGTYGDVTIVNKEAERAFRRR